MNKVWNAQTNSFRFRGFENVPMCLFLARTKRKVGALDVEKLGRSPVPFSAFPLLCSKTLLIARWHGGLSNKKKKKELFPLVSWEQITTFLCVQIWTNEIRLVCGPFLLERDLDPFGFLLSL